MVSLLLQPHLDLAVVPDPQFANSRVYRRPFGALFNTHFLHLSTTYDIHDGVSQRQVRRDCVREASVYPAAGAETGLRTDKEKTKGGASGSKQTSAKTKGGKGGSRTSARGK